MFPKWGPPCLLQLGVCATLSFELRCFRDGTGESSRHDFSNLDIQSPFQVVVGWLVAEQLAQDAADLMFVLHIQLEHREATSAYWTDRYKYDLQIYKIWMLMFVRHLQQALVKLFTKSQSQHWVHEVHFRDLDLQRETGWKLWLTACLCCLEHTEHVGTCGPGQSVRSVRSRSALVCAQPRLALNVNKCAPPGHNAQVSLEPLSGVNTLISKLQMEGKKCTNK